MILWKSNIVIAKVDCISFFKAAVSNYRDLRYDEGHKLKPAQG